MCNLVVLVCLPSFPPPSVFFSPLQASLSPPPCKRHPHPVWFWDEVLLHTTGLAASLWRGGGVGCCYVLFIVALPRRRAAADATIHSWADSSPPALPACPWLHTCLSRGNIFPHLPLHYIRLHSIPFTPPLRAVRSTPPKKKLSRPIPSRPIPSDQALPHPRLGGGRGGDGAVPPKHRPRVHPGSAGADVGPREPAGAGRAAAGVPRAQLLLAGL